METVNAELNDSSGLKKYLSPINVWALSFGCAVGWGAFVMPGTTFLPIAGPLGTALGIFIGGIVMLLIGYNYNYMMRYFSDSGGTFTYAKKILGHDHGFLSAWFIVLVYIAIAWANATALTIIARNLFGNFFQVGFHYQIAGFDIYFGEALLSLFALWICGLLCIRGGKVIATIQTCAALILFGGILLCFVGVIHSGVNIFELQPAFAPDKNFLASLVGIIVLAPWAFVGFESVSHSTEEFKFQKKKFFSILLAAIITATLAYIFLSIIAISILPAGYANWFEYIGDLDNLSGYEGLPTLYVFNEIFGDNAVLIFMVTVLAAIVTGLIGNSIAASRLIYALAKDDLLPAWFAKVNGFGSPQNAIFFIMLLSLPIPFLGRAAVSWIIDVNTIGATIAYGYTSAVAFLKARVEKNLLVEVTGLIGTVVSVIFFLYFMVPSFWIVSAMATESYLILIAWSILGFVFFRYIFNRDGERKRFGKSTVVWMMMLFMIFFTAMMWMRETTHSLTHDVLQSLNDYYLVKMKEHAVIPSEVEKAYSEQHIQVQMDLVNQQLRDNNFLQMTLIIIALFIMFNLYNLMMRRQNEIEMQKYEAERSNKAKSIFLSNMSHDIRTPMNAIIGYVELSKQLRSFCETCEHCGLERCPHNVLNKNYDYLRKIENSSQQLLALINDILDMSRIESGKMELNPEKSNLKKFMSEVYDMFATQMETKNISYLVNAEVENKFVLCDIHLLNRVMLNLISNAYKFTPEGGTVSVTLNQTGAEENFAKYEIRVKDTGMGMSKEFAAKVFDAYERDRSVNKIQGTGLGTAITKSIVDLMGGNIAVKTELGEGTEFIVKIKFEIVEGEPEEVAEESSVVESEIDFSKMKLLLVEDNEVNREIATLILTEYGFSLETAENGKIAVGKIKKSKPGDFDAILMDIQMPEMNGYEATKKIRALENPQLANIPIIAMTANAFVEDIQAAKDAGMNSHIAKPIDIAAMIETLTEVLREK